MGGGGILRADALKVREVLVDLANSEVKIRNIEDGAEAAVIVRTCCWCEDQPCGTKDYSHSCPCGWPLGKNPHPDKRLNSKQHYRISLW